MEIKNKTEELDDDEDDIIISESASNNSHSGNESGSESENSSHQTGKHKKLKNTENKNNKKNTSIEIIEEKPVILDDENSNLVYSRIHGYRILVPDKNDSKAFYKKILGGLKEVRIVMTYLSFWRRNFEFLVVITKIVSFDGILYFRDILFCSCFFLLPFFNLLIPPLLP